ncbi:hypothetical protein ACOMHN_000889 [Nucella lapillus]
MAELSCMGIVWLTLSTLAALGAGSGFFLPYWIRGSYLPPPSATLPLTPPPTHSPILPTPTPTTTTTYPVPVYLGIFRRCNYLRLVTEGNNNDNVGSSGYERSKDDGVGRVGGSSSSSSRGASQEEVINGWSSSSSSQGVEVVLECGRYTEFTDIPSVWWQIGTVICGTGSALALLVAMTGAWALCVRYVLTKGTAKVAAGMQLMAGLLIGGGMALYPLGWENREFRQVCGPSASVFRLALRLLSHSTSRLQDDVYKHIMELGILHNSPPSTKRGCRAGRLHRLWHGLPPAPWPCTRSQHHSVPSRNLHPLMVPPFLQPHPDLQSAVGNAPLSSKHPAQLPTTDCLLSIISPMGGQPSDAPALSPPSPLQQGGQSSNAPALSPPSPLPQGGQPIALALSPPSPPLQGGQPSDAPGLLPSSSTLLLCPSDSTLNICHLNSQSAVKTGDCELYWAFYLTASAGGLTLLCATLAICAPSSKAEYS